MASFRFRGVLPVLLSTFCCAYFSSLRGLWCVSSWLCLAGSFSLLFFPCIGVFYLCVLSFFFFFLWFSSSFWVLLLPLGAWAFFSFVFRFFPWVVVLFSLFFFGGFWFLSGLGFLPFLSAGFFFRFAGFCSVGAYSRVGVSSALYWLFAVLLLCGCWCFVCVVF